MNNEIKEILDFIDDRVIPNEKWNKVKDYITNLQEEKKIPEKLGINDINTLDLFTKVNEIIDYLHYLKSKGDN